VRGGFIFTFRTNAILKQWRYFLINFPPVPLNFADRGLISLTTSWMRCRLVLPNFIVG
jgi:hypothetical protein